MPVSDGGPAAGLFFPEMLPVLTHLQGSHLSWPAPLPGAWTVFLLSWPPFPRICYGGDNTSPAHCIGLLESSEVRDIVNSEGLFTDASGYYGTHPGHLEC